MRLPGLSSILLHFFLAGFDKNSQSDDVKTETSLRSLLESFRAAEARANVAARYDASGNMDSANAANRAAAKRAFRKLRKAFLAQTALSGLDADLSFIAFLSR